MNRIKSSDIIPEFDRHMKVSAGPGAGKTTWLAAHICNVVRNSRYLHKAARILCISYTNIACDALLKKISNVADSVEACTIHSFLYKNVVRPFLHLLKDQDGNPLVAHTLVQNHYEPNPMFHRIRDWLADIGYSPKKPQMQTVLANDPEVKAYLRRLIWRRNDDGSWKVTVIRRAPPKGLPTTHLFEYKKRLWKSGIIEHDDVLYFAYRILENYPQLRVHLSARFPYVFIDEFQDTDPRQTQILKWLAEDGRSKVCIIGDPMQSIFGFTGAIMRDFTEFTLDNIMNYEIADNWRSTDRIIKLLNNARADKMVQSGLRRVAGESVSILIGNERQVLNNLRATVGDAKLPVILARDNNVAGLLRSLKEGQNFESSPWALLDEADGDRFLFFKGLFEGLTMLRSNHPGLSVKKFLDGFRIKNGENGVIKSAGYITDSMHKAIAVTFLSYMNSNYDQKKDRPFIETYEELSAYLGNFITGASLKSIRPGKFRSLAEGNSLKIFVDTVGIAEDNRDVRTIHKAKGDEFKHVLVCLPEEDALDHIFNYANVKAGEMEEQRITYVAISRAMDKLYIAAPSLSTERENQIVKQNLELEIIRTN